MRRKVRVFTITAPELILNRTKRTIRRSGRILTQIYVEHQRPLPLIRWCLDHERAKVQVDKISRLLMERKEHEPEEDQ